MGRPVLLGFGNLSEPAIEQGIRLLARRWPKQNYT